MTNAAALVIPAEAGIQQNIVIPVKTVSTIVIPVKTVSTIVIPGENRNPVHFWTPAFAGETIL